MKKTITLLLTLCLSAFSFGQNVNIPDANFKKILVLNTAINTNNDDEISEKEAEVFTGRINVSRQLISDLTGIEFFINLTELNCGYNSLQTLDVTKNVSLTRLDCSSNELTSLDVTKNINLTSLSCGLNKLMTLDVSKLVALRGFGCEDNLLKSLDVSKLVSLTYLDCKRNTTTKICVASNHVTLGWRKDADAFFIKNCEPLAFSEKQSTEKAQVLKAYNLQGQEIPVNTKGEVIILLYDNGTREKTYIAE